MRFVTSGSDLNLNALVKCHIHWAIGSNFRIRKNVFSR